jgi:hypothetical protein
MKLIQDDIAQFRMKGVEAEKLDYQIVDSPELKLLLSGGVYKDKPRAIIRELSTNALDAHISAKNLDTPIEVQLPTYKNPVFKIRDYGTGLAKSQMETMYRQYGNSNKNKDDAFNGCMGIGSKAPFSYANIWTATSYFNGVKHVYQNAKDDKGSPVLIPVGDFPTEEPNGLEVSFNVKAQDCPVFVEAAKEVYRPFVNKPKVTSHEGFKPESYQVRYQGKGKVKWMLTGGESLAVMSNVEYPIDSKFFGKKKVEELVQYERNESTKYQRLLDAGVVIEFPNGSIQFNIGREELQYTDYTVRQVKDRLDEIFQELTDYVQSLFTGAKTLWEARVVYRSLRQGNLRVFNDILADIPVQWNGIDIRGDAVDLPKGMNCQFFTKEGYRVHPKRYVRTCVSVTHHKIGFVINDLTVGGFIASERLIEQDGYNGIYLLNFPDDATKQAFCDVVGISPNDFVLASSVPKPPKQARKANRDAVYSLNLQSKGYQRNWRGYWNKEDISMDDGGVFVEISNWSVSRGKMGNSNPAYINSELAKLEALGLPIPKVYGIKSVKFEKFHKHPKWQLFNEWFKEQVESYIKKHNIQKAVDSLLAVSELNDKFSHYHHLSNKFQSTKSVVAYDFLNTIKEVKKKASVSTEVSNIIHTARSLGLIETNKQIVGEIRDKETKFLARFPMLKFVRLNDADSVPEVINYIKGMSNE